jgi:hypothetical protein
MGGESGRSVEIGCFFGVLGCRSWECDKADIIARLWVGAESDIEHG